MRKKKGKPSGITLPAGGVTYSYKISVAGVTYRGSTGCQDRREASMFVERLRKEVAATNILNNIGKGRYKNIDRDFPLYNVVDRFWELKGSKDKSKRSTTRLLSEILRSFGESKMMSEINDEDVLLFLQKLTRRVSQTSQQAISNGYINQHIKMLRRVYRFAGDREGGKLRLPLPAIDWEDAFLPEGIRKRVLSSEEEVLMLSDGSNLATVTRFGLLCGLRKSNLVGLKWSEVDFVKGEITVCQKASKKKKSPDANTHTLQMTIEMREILTAQLPHKEAGEGQVWTVVADRTGCTPKSQRRTVKGQRYPLHVQKFDRWFVRRARENKLDIVVHDLRRTTGSRVLNTTGSLSFAQHVLGHASPFTTAKYYAQPNDTNLLTAMEAANRSGWDRP